MILYTKAFSAFLHSSPGIIQDKVQFIHPHEIFKSGFTPDALCDGVHLHPEATKLLAQFIFSLLSSKRRFRPANLTNDDFYSYLEKYKVIKSSATSNDLQGASDTEMVAPIDVAIKLSNN